MFDNICVPCEVIFRVACECNYAERALLVYRLVVCLLFWVVSLSVVGFVMPLCRLGCFAFVGFWVFCLCVGFWVFVRCFYSVHFCS